MFSAHDETDVRYDKADVLFFYSRGNTLTGKFRSCSDFVNIELFKKFICNMYCSHWWCSFTKTVFNKLHVSFNNVFRYFMGIGVGQSISSNLVCRSFNTFNALWQNYVTKFMERLDCSVNFILVIIRNLLFFSLQSKLNLFWTRFLS